MQEFDVVERIRELCKSRSLTYYRLSKNSGIPYSTLSTMLNKTNVPSLPSLMKICDGLDISLAQFFSDKDETVILSSDQRHCLELWGQLDSQSKKLAIAYMEGLSAKQNSSR